MADTHRAHSDADLYHVVARGVGRQLIFEDDADRAAYTDLLYGQARKRGAEIVAHALVENHTHAVVQVPYERLGAFMKVVLGAYARSFNRRHERTGHLLEGPFHSEPINDDTYLLTVVRYVHQNPLKAGLAGGLLYPWSSYGRYLAGDGSPLVMGLLGSTDAFVRFHEAPGTLCDGVRPPLPRGTARNAEALIDAAREALGADPSTVKGVPREQRDASLRLLVETGFSVRQVELVTGVSHATVQRVTSRAA